MLTDDMDDPKHHVYISRRSTRSTYTWMPSTVRCSSNARLRDFKEGILPIYFNVLSSTEAQPRRFKDDSLDSGKKQRTDGCKEGRNEGRKEGRRGRDEHRWPTRYAVGRSCEREIERDTVLKVETRQTLPREAWKHGEVPLL